MIDIVVGGQFGSEGKGKVAHWLASRSSHKTVIRTGGCNSGHTISNYILRHLPCAALIENGTCIIGAGSYLDLNLLLKEIEFHQPKLFIDGNATIITGHEDQSLERLIGSTMSGTGNGVLRRASRINATLARDVPELRPYLCTLKDIHSLISRGAILEGTQGFGLSLLHSPYYPYCTSRDTTASGFASELGISPKDIGDIYLVIRSFPIRVGGNSGPLPDEVEWSTIGVKPEYTSVTHRKRRVALFDPEIVRLAIKVNNPTFIVLNHMDYVFENQESFIREIEEEINRRIDFIGTDKYSIRRHQ